MDEIKPRVGILTSWKEIASFFNRNVRTVQRWEREERLPVHRHPHHRRSSVYAYPDELEAWWAQYQGGDRGLENGPEPAAVVTGEPRSEIGRVSDAALMRGDHPARPAIRWAWVGAVLCGAIAGATGLFVYAFGNSELPGYPIHDFAIVGTTAPLEVRTLDDLNGDGRGDLVVDVVLGHETQLYFGASTSLRTSPDVRITSDALGHPSGASVGDVDGDGLADLVVSILLAEPAGFTATGSSYLIRGRRDWPQSLQLPRDADSEFFVPLRTDIRMVVCTSPRGVDLNGDGLRDILLGGADYSPPGRRSAGGAFVFFGRRAWPARVDVTESADVTVYGSRTGEALRPLCSSGDFTGDGVTDLALAATEDTLWGLQGGRGRVYVFAGAREWPRLIDAERDAVLQLRGSSPRTRLDRPVLADINGDTVADLVAAFGDPEHRTGGGRVSIVLGATTRHGTLDDRDADVVINGGPSFGTLIGPADVNLDGCDDLIVTEPGTGNVHLLIGQRLVATPGRGTGIKSQLLFAGGRGTAIGGVGIGDQDGDGAPDLILEVGSPTTVGIRRLARLSPALPIDIDVRPGVTPNVLVPNGVLAVEIRAASLARDLDAPSLRLAGTAPTEVSWQDFDGNGSLDLRLYFDVSKLPVPAGATRLALRGRTRDGLPVAGSDDIVVVIPDQGRR